MEHINGVLITPLKRIAGEKGGVLHGIKKTDPGFVDFGEAYFSTVNYQMIKGWKKHQKMTMNLVVPQGSIKFVVYDDRENSPTQGIFQSFMLSANNYCRLTVPPQVWMAFEGIGQDLNLLMNVADIVHDPDEQINVPLDHPNFKAYVW